MKNKSRRKSDARPLRGLLYGAVAGLAAAWAMNQFQSLIGRATSSGSQPQSPQAEEQSEDATMKAAGRLARAASFRPLSHQEKSVAGPVVHYAFGTAMGALYGLTAEYVPQARAGFGTLFGTLLFAVADEIAVPLAGFSGAPGEYPLSSHVRALASHVVYGASAEAVRIGLKKVA